MVKSNKKRILTIFTTLTILMATLISCNSYAITTGGEDYYSNSSGGAGNYSFNDLQDNWWLLCGQRGQHIPSSNSMSNAYIYSGDTINDGTAVATSTLNAYSENLSSPRSSIYYGKKYENENEPAYKVEKTNNICTPDEAYILNHAKENVGSYFSSVQKAWWTTNANVSGVTAGGNELSAAAKNYKKFVKNIAKNPSDVNNPSTYKTYKHKYADGKEVKIKFPEIDTKKIEQGLSFDRKNAKVSFDSENNKYLIGPFKLNYAQGGANGVDFGNISNFKIYTDASNDPITDSQWNFIYSGDKNPGKDIPGSGEEFFIQMDYIEGATKISNISMDYKYLIAGANYDTLTGTYDRYKWVLTKGSGVESSKDADGNYTEYNYTMKAKNQGLALESQKLNVAKSAAYWYETVNLSVGGPQLVTLNIKKVALDENGKELSQDQVKELFGEDQVFHFDVKVKEGDKDLKPITVDVKAGETVQVGMFGLSQNKSKLTYEVTERDFDENSGWKKVRIENAKGDLTGDTPVTVVAINQYKPQEEDLTINKRISGVADSDETFEFNMVVNYPNGKQDSRIAKITVPKGQSEAPAWKASENGGKYKWYGSKDATYKVIEIETEASKKYEPIIDKPEGTLGKDNPEAIVKVLNNENDDNHYGYLTVEKKLAEGDVTNDDYKFNIKVDGAINEGPGEVMVKAGQKAGPYKFVWKGDKAPTFEVTETDDVAKKNEVEKVNIETNGGENVVKDEAGKRVTGSLTDKGTADVSAIFTNDVTNHEGNIKVIKKFCSTEKMTDEDLKDAIKDINATFDVKVTIEGTFIYKDKTYQNSNVVITDKLSKDNNWEFAINGIKWSGPNAPTYKVEEIAENNCEYKYDHYYCTNDGKEVTDTEGHILTDGKTVEYTLFNRIPSQTEIDLTFSMAGIAWVDKALDKKNDANDGYYKEANGVYDDGEILKDNVEVVVYKVKYKGDQVVSREPAVAYKDVQNNEISFPLITATDGAWNVPRITVPGLTEEEKNAGFTKADYDVEFVYDGQTYEPTQFLSYQINGDTKTKNSGSNSEKAKTYRNADKSVKKCYEKDSMAIKDLTEAQKANTITEVSGKTEINANGETTGIVKLANGQNAEIQYTSDDAGIAYPTHSKVKTTAENGRTLDIFKASATTKAGNLTFPFDVDGYDGSSLTGQHVDLTERGFKHSYKFFAVYNYCLHINLGLVERDAADLSLTKNLSTAKVVVNEKMYQYNYSGKFDLTEVKKDSLNQDIKVEGYYVDNNKVKEAGDKVEFTLGLYKSDYYYRAEMYNKAKDDMYEALTNFYATMNKPVTDTEMDVYLTYKIKLANAGGYDAIVNSIDDYYENTLELVKAQETKYLKTQTGVMYEDGIHGEETVNAEVPVATPSDFADKWQVVKTAIAGSDKDVDNNIIYSKMTGNNLGIKLASGESKEFTLTYKVLKGTDAQGVKNAIKLGQKSNVAEIASYSTFNKGTGDYAGKIDRDSAPANVNIANYNQKSWYEDDTFAAPRIKVTTDAKDTARTINGLVWEDNSNGDKEDQQDHNDTMYNQYVGNGVKEDNEEIISNLTTELYTKVDVKNADGKYKEYDYLWPTSVPMTELGGKTMEELLGFDTTTVTSDKGEYIFDNVITGDYVVKFTYGDKADMKTASYSTAEFYNGQDFKSSKFKAQLLSGDKIQADSYLNIHSLNATDSKKPNNTAVDSERRRLAVIAKSRELDYDKTSKLKNYDNAIFGLDGYAMFAETPKIDMNIEKTENSYDQKSGEITEKFDVNNVSFGLEERPITQLSLDKQIEEIIITTSDGKQIMDAKYNISYPVENIDAKTGKITAKIELDKANSYGIDNLQYINRDEATTQGYRYINVDSTILEGATITVKYRFTALNTGEVDRTGKIADMKYEEDATQFDTAAKDLSDKLSVFTLKDGKLVNETKIGDYVGQIYYYGADGGNTDKIVSSTVRQLVDYADNNVLFSGESNSAKDTSWKNVTIEEIKPYIDNSIIKDENIVDSKGVQYVTENRSNLLMSVDSADQNSGFIIELQPKEADYSKCMGTMNLTVSKVIDATDSDLQIDNIAEIIKYNNKVGRRDELSIAGNINPVEATKKDPTIIPTSSDKTISFAMPYERDSSATEVITLSPPTGIGLTMWRLQILGTVAAGLGILAGGIIIIKKKVLKK